MSKAKTKVFGKLDLGSLPDLHSLHLERLNPLYLVVSGAVSLAILAVLLFAGGTSQ